MNGDIKNTTPAGEEGRDNESEVISDLKGKVNVDQAAIDEARAAVGNDDEKIREYLINNRGL
ncbi:hypothetical protein [Pedobacter deserti]|uniref:hypothetical protein n=1 Tax=Pedobacter deserti TaxID=2817382 RepID=UPI00210BFC46|nr:hypothetical protein [Pedobacter sp. SYSU D00382]